MEVGLQLLVTAQASILLLSFCLLLPSGCPGSALGQRLAPAFGNLLERARGCGGVCAASEVAGCCAAQRGPRLIAPLLGRRRQRCKFSLQGTSHKMPLTSATPADLQILRRHSAGSNDLLLMFQVPSMPVKAT